MSLGAMMASSAVVSVAIAIVSWKLIEERALAMKGDFAEATSRAFNLGLAKIASRRALTRGAWFGALERLLAPTERFQGVRRQKPVTFRVSRVCDTAVINLLYITL